MARLAGPCVRLTFLLAMSSGACAVPAQSPDPAKLCELVVAAEAAGDDYPLIMGLAEAFKVRPSDLRADARGVFIPQTRVLAEERGVFVARPGVAVPGSEGDPSFRKVAGCVYQYRIKG